MDEVLREFLVESYENLDRLDQEFVLLEQEPTRPDLLASVFRTIHTIKGTCGFLGFGRLEKLTHAGEALLAKLRAGDVALDQDRVTTLLTMVDEVRGMLATIESAGNDGEHSHDRLVERLYELSRPTVRPTPTPTAPPAPIPAPTPAPAPTADPDEDEPAIGRSPTAAAPSAADASVRVDVGLLDTLMNLVGELVLARNQLQRILTATTDPSLAATFQRVDLITSELQEGMMKTRMQTVGTVWSKLPRLVRDVSAVCGKSVRLVLEGQDTEVDRTLLDAIRDPLTHMVRNAIDHGIEAPPARSAAGKPEQGTVRVHAWHEGGQVNIEITDDGAGIPVERVRSAAVERGLVSTDAAARLSDREVTELVFLPGFSTAEEVTAVSGRGVGMDVVRTHIVAVGGTVDIASEPGVGTALRIRVPLTLAILPALLVEAVDEVFAIPQVNVVQLLRFEPTGTSLETVHEARVFRHRDDLLPLLMLDEELGLRARHATPRETEVLVLQAGDRRFGLAVDRVGDTAEIVVKPLASALKGLGTYSGATITGDGGVALILDVAGLGRRARLAVERGDVAKPADAAIALGPARERLLIVGTPDDGRAAIRLDRVDRVEEIPAADIERISGQEVLQYRGNVLPLTRLCQALGVEAGPPTEVVSVVVHGSPYGLVGIVVERVHDIVETALDRQDTGTRAGIEFTAIVGERVTEIIDVDWVLDRAREARHG